MYICDMYNVVYVLGVFFVFTLISFNLLGWGCPWGVIVIMIVCYFNAKNEKLKSYFPTPNNECYLVNLLFSFL